MNKSQTKRNVSSEVFLLVEGIDFTRPIYGSGNASVVASALRYFGPLAIVVGVTSDYHQLGQWTTVTLNGVTHRFLPIITADRIKHPRTRSANIDLGLAIFRYRAALSEVGVSKVFTRTYAVLWALNAMRRKWDVCFYYPGLGNPMIVGRKARFTRYLAGTYQWAQAKALDQNVSRAFAAGPEREIFEYNAYLEGQGVKTRVSALSTAVDTTTFRPMARTDFREAQGLLPNDKVLSFVGRLAEVKGIPLLIDALERVNAATPYRVVLLLIGDGELRAQLETLVAHRGLQDKVIFTGMLPRNQVAQAIAASDACVVGSFTEGFSNAMLEQLAVGKPIVSTDVSGASDVIADGKNGFIITGRDPNAFAAAILKAFDLQDVEAYNLNLVRSRYSEGAQWGRVARDWLSPE